MVERILTLAARAPSGNNTQPWSVHAVVGAVKTALETDLCAAFDDPTFETEDDYLTYPRRWPEPYATRRRTVGWALYQSLGIAKRDTRAMRQFHQRNLTFFGAPVGLFVTMDRLLEKASWLDAGMFLQSLMLAARGEGLHTCPQAMFVPYHRVVRRHVPIPETQVLLCGVALGYEDPTQPENDLRTQREPVDTFATFHGW